MNCRLLYILGTLRYGGTERQLLNLLRAMDRHKYRPGLVVWSYEENAPLIESFRDIDVPVLGLVPRWSFARKLRELRRHTRRLQPQIVHAYAFFLNIAAACASRHTPAIPVGSIRNDFVTERSVFVPAKHRALRAVPILGWMINAPEYINGRLSSRWPEHMICNSRAARQTATGFGGPFRPRNVRVVRNGLDVSAYAAPPPPLPTQPIVLGVGRLAAQKRWDLLLRATHTLAAEGMDFQVRHAGGYGDKGDELRTLTRSLQIEGRVKFLGFDDDVPGLLARSSLVVQTSDHEGCPNIVMEAMAAGRAVVATDAGDTRLLIDHEKTGFVVRPGDTAGLVTRMRSLIQDPRLCRQFGEAGRRKAEAEFGVDRLVDGTLAAYREFGWMDT